MAKLSLSDLTSIVGNEGAAITLLNNNWAAIEAAVENTLSRDGTNPNMMEADLDMNTNDILNVGTLGASVINVETLNATELNADEANVDTLNVDELWVGGFQFDANGELRNFRLRSLIDVDLTGLAVNDSIKWNGTYWVPGTGAGGIAWGSITGTLSDQTDLQTALNGKSNTGHTHVVADITDYVAYTDEKAQDAVGTMIDGTLVYVDATPLLTRAALTGDITAAQGSNATTLATVNSNVGSFGSATETVTFTVNGKGLVTAASEQSIAIPSTQVTDFTEATQDIIGALLVSSNTITISYNDAGNSMTVTRAALGGDISASANSNITTLATVNSNVGSFGSATQVMTQTVNAKGLTTAAANVSIAIPSTQVTDFNEAAQDAIGAMVDSSLVYTDATPLLQRAALTGDVTASAGSNATTLATVNSNTGSWGSATQVPTFTVNGKGLITAASNTSISIPSSAVTDFNTAGDARWVNVSGDTMTGSLTVQASIVAQPTSGSVQIDAVADGGNATVRSFSYSTGGLTAINSTFKARGSLASPALLQNGDNVGVFQASAWTSGTTFSPVMRMRTDVTEPTPTATAYGVSWDLQLSPLGALTLVSVLKADADNGLQYRTRTFLDGNSLVQLRSTTLAGAFTGATAKLGFFSNVGQDGAPVYHDGTRYKQMGEGGYQTVATNAAFTITPMTSPVHTRHTGTLTANRIVTLSNTNAYPGYRTYITRTGAGAFTLDVQTAGGGALKSLATNTWALFIHDGTDHYLAAYGAL